ncbi:hypothetical protein [Nitratireductor basaltis]|uniref:Fenitrothion hydrolase n=1 Tax=Nitratireductor basaltis TaxID=472175 RepID=A0A084U6G0_9HYPH|nr:hypothetical protein [Nitratireductor basaltis]KFB08546.1 hypothetical protein EL18_02798 [Nitratireductor basaltis]
MTRVLAVFPLLCLTTAEALAHASERGHVLLLPTHLYLWGGALTVAASFLMLLALPPQVLVRAFGHRMHISDISIAPLWVIGIFSSLLVLVGLLAGWLGSRDPLSNPLPLLIWTLLWLSLPLLHALVGDMWRWLNPWTALWRAIGKPGLNLRLPRRVGYWPATLLLFCFAWLELVYPAPDDPRQLAMFTAAYFLLTMAGILAFGHRRWMARGEFLGIFFRTAARLSPLASSGIGRRRKLSLTIPGGRLSRVHPLPLSGIAFVLLLIAYISFDGLMKTFTWLHMIGTNPLLYPGRTALLLPNSLGLSGAWAGFSLCFFAAVLAGDRMAGGRAPMRAAGLLIWSLIPIALAYHFSHYLVVMLVNLQYAFVAASDPFATGLNLFGTADYHVRAGVVLGAHAAQLIWNAQAIAIVGGHVLAVALAHGLALRHYGTADRAFRSQVPMAMLMIFYTLLGLWLLSSPTAG